MTRAVTQVTAEDLAAWWPVPGADSHKYTRGVVGIDTGSEDYPGAALLSIAGALGAGPGMARYLGTAPRDLILGRFPSVVLVPGQVQALVVGSGWGQRPDAEARLSGAVSRGVPLLVDADALQLLPAHLPPESPPTLGNSPVCCPCVGPRWRRTLLPQPVRLPVHSGARCC